MPKLAIRAFLACCILAVPPSLYGGGASNDRQPVGSGGAGPVKKFSFGTPTSATRAGFTKVTVQDAFTSEKGYGFRSTKGIDRGGSKIELPKWKEAKYVSARPPLELTREEQERGYVVFPADHTEQIVPGYVSARTAVGAVRVTDEVARSGRFSLKWDLSSEGGRSIPSERMYPT